MNLIGLYEKALPKELTLAKKLVLTKELGFDFMQLSIDENPDRLARLDWEDVKIEAIRQVMLKEQITIHSLSVSANRQYPLGSSQPEIRQQGVQILKKAIDFALKIGARNILVAGYDVFYEDKTILSRHYYIENLKAVVAYAGTKGMMLSIETMDDPFTKSIQKILAIKSQIPSPWLQIYPDLGNLSAWLGAEIAQELEAGISYITEIHFKDAISVESDGVGKFRDVNFGEGSVDFEGCLQILKKLNYPGPFVIEMWSEDSPNYRQEIKNAKKFLEQELAKIK